MGLALQAENRHHNTVYHSTHWAQTLLIYLMAIQTQACWYNMSPLTKPMGNPPVPITWMAVLFSRSEERGTWASREMSVSSRLKA